MDGRNDPFIAKFLSRVPSDIAASFTDDQLLAVKMAFGARSWGIHAVDFRRSFLLFGHRLYVVLLMGRERRTADRLRAEHALFGPLGNSFVTALFLCGLALPLLAALYVLKSAAGIDVIPDGGLHTLWQDLMGQFDRAMH